MKYQAVLFSVDGGFVTDFQSPSKQQVWDKISNMGSRWIFYPFCFVSTDKTIVDTPEGLEWLKGKRIETVKQYFVDEYENNYETLMYIANGEVPISELFSYVH